MHRKPPTRQLPRAAKVTGDKDVSICTNVAGQPGLWMTPRLPRMCTRRRFEDWSGSTGGVTAFASFGLRFAAYFKQAALEPFAYLILPLGAGDLPIALWQKGPPAATLWTSRDGTFTRVPSPMRSENAHKRGANVRFAQRDALEDSGTDSYDVVTCSLFLHHLSPDQAVELLRRMSLPGQTAGAGQRSRRSSLWTSLGGGLGLQDCLRHLKWSTRMDLDR